MATKILSKVIFFSLFIVIATNIFGQTPPPAPTGFRVTSAECGKISFAWDDYPAGLIEDGFRIIKYIPQNNGSNAYFSKDIVANQTNYSDVGFTYENGGYSENGVIY
jgi:hypothetical protein